MSRPSKPEYRRRSKLFLVRLTPSEFSHYERWARKVGTTVAEILRKGAEMYIQKGHVSDPIRTRSGIKFVIRYRVRMADGKWKHKAETLYGLARKKEAKAVLEQRIAQCSRQITRLNLTLQQFIDAYWKPYLDRRRIKPSTREVYESGIRRHVLQTLGTFR